MKPHAAGGGDLTRLLVQRALAVTGSLRLPFALLFLFIAATVLSCRTAVRRRSSPPPLQMALPSLPPSWNATWLRLAAGEVPPLDGEAEIEDLLERHRTSPLLRRFNRVDAAGRRTVSWLRMSEDPRVALEVSRALRQWVQYRRYQPDVMGELLQLIRVPIEQRQGGRTMARPYASCAVVGNSGILLQHEFGELIDSHELVIRLNNARINGFHRNVGTKTGLSFINSNILHLCNRRPSCYCHPYGEKVPLVMYICQAIHFLDYNICSASHKAPLLITDARFDLLCSRIVKYYSLKRFAEEMGKTPQEWNKTHDAKMFHYSSGMQAVMLAIGICDKVSIFGFGKSEEAKHHYHTNQKKELDLHDYEAEYMLYHDLIEKPEAIPFLADSKFVVPPVVMYQ